MENEINGTRKKWKRFVYWRGSGGTEKHELGKEVVVADYLFVKSEKESCV